GVRGVAASVTLHGTSPWHLRWSQIFKRSSSNDGDARNDSISGSVVIRFLSLKPASTARSSQRKPSTSSPPRASEHATLYAVLGSRLLSNASAPASAATVK